MVIREAVMDWSVLLGIGIAGYSAVILIRWIRRMGKGACPGCPYSGSCAGACRERDRKTKQNGQKPGADRSLSSL